MATRSNISIHINKEDIGLIKKFDIKKLPDGVHYPCEFITKVDEVSLGEYLTIYCHFDGYPTHVGEVLLTDYNTYDKVLNLILGGSISSLNHDSVTQYCAWRDEDWLHCKPVLTLNKPKCDEDFLYIFDNNQWFITSSRKEDEMLLLADVLSKK